MVNIKDKITNLFKKKELTEEELFIELEIKKMPKKRRQKSRLLLIDYHKGNCTKVGGINGKVSK